MRLAKAKEMRSRETEARTFSDSCSNRLTLETSFIIEIIEADYAY